nr:LuxR C-terminal-related transcriptional regulator [Adlercreutzia caecimuris]
MVASILLVLLVYVAVWHFTEERVNDFFAGELPASAEEEGSRQFEREAEVARRYRLTSREQEILDLYARGRSAVFIAEQLSISPATVRSHVKHIYEKCLVHSRQELLSLIDGQALE